MTAKTPEEAAADYLAEFRDHPGLAMTPTARARFSALLDRITTLKRERDEAYRKGAEAMRDKARDRAYETAKRLSMPREFAECVSRSIAAIPTPDQEGE